MTNPALEEFRKQIEALRVHPAVAPHLEGDMIRAADMPMSDVAKLLAEDAGYYLLIAAASLNRTSLKKAMAEPEAQVVAARQRRAFAVKIRLPLTSSFGSLCASAIALRQGDLQRKARGQIEQVFRDRLIEEGVPLLMSPPVRQVPGVVISKRKPDGVWPDPALGLPPLIYLEIKNIRRVADDIQKRLYELVEASLEMKLLYGNLRLSGLGIERTHLVADSGTAAALRSQIEGQPPVVVGLLICARGEAERYRPGAEAFIDRIFFQEEVEECIDFIKDTIARLDP